MIVPPFLTSEQLNRTVLSRPVTAANLKAVESLVTVQSADQSPLIMRFLLRQQVQVRQCDSKLQDYWLEFYIFSLYFIWKSTEVLAFDDIWNVISSTECSQGGTTDGRLVTESLTYGVMSEISYFKFQFVNLNKERLYI